MSVSVGGVDEGVSAYGGWGVCVCMCVTVTTVQRVGAQWPGQHSLTSATHRHS